MAMFTAPAGGRYLATVQIRLLGSVAAVDGEESLPLGGLRERALLALLALSPGQVISTDRLIDELWGEDLPAKPANALQALVSRLRRSIGTDTISTRAPGYLLDIPDEDVDASRFRSLVAAAATTADAPKRSALYRDALELWRGPALAEFALEEFAQREAAALEEMRISAVEARIAADLESGAGGDLVPEIEDLVVAHPLRESLRASQMLALYRAGRQADALRAFAAARDTLGEELGIEPGRELKALEEQILLQDPQLTIEPAVASASTLPSRLASFVGRQQEMADVVDAFSSSRLVTLAGPGGAGKTSLAIEVGRSLEVDYPDGVWLIELAPITESPRVADAVVTALHLEQGARLGGVSLPDVDSEATIVEYLRHRRALLILDNCEHLVSAAAHLAEVVLLSCPEVEVLATSRDRLGVPGELLWRVPPLDSEDGHSDAVNLFVSRARAVSPSFDPTPEELDRIADLCRRVDGMPLAIELAAARSRALSIGEIARRLDDGIAVLSDRQQSLQGAIDWSYELLALPERDLFAALSVFHGTFSLDAVEAVGGELETLERLIDSSMVAPLSMGYDVRYRMLETLRTYAGERLAAAGQADYVMARLSEFYSTLLEHAEDGLRGPGQLDWLGRIEADHDSIRAVLDWGVEHSPVAALRLAGRIGWYWYLRGNSAEARDRFSRLLDAAGPAADDRARGDALMFGALCATRPEHVVGGGFAAASEAYAAAGHQEGVVNARAMVAAWGSDLDQTLRVLDEAYEAAAAIGYGWGMALVRFLQAGAALGGNDNPAAVRLAREAIDGFTELGDRWGLGYGFYQLGTALRALGEYSQAEDALQAAVEHARPMQLRREMAPVLCELGSIAIMRGEYQRAETLLRDAERYADETPFAGSQGMVRNARGRLARLRGDVDGSLALHQQAIGFYKEGDAHGGLAWSHSCAGYAEEMRGNLKAAMGHHRTALGYANETGDVFAIAQALEGLGATLIADGDSERGVELIHAGLALRERSETPLPAGERFDVDRAMEAAGATLDSRALRAAADSGKTLELLQAMAAAEGIDW